MTTPIEEAIPVDPDHAGFGIVQTITDLKLGEKSDHVLVRLGQLPATAICGNDITSSCLYVSAICALYAGPYAPLSLMIVAVVLFLFRKIYGEVGTALPLNGGAYNVLLNTTSKSTASVAACLTLLSYIATAVISAYEASHYAHTLLHSIPVIPATICLLGIFTLLGIVGITESAIVATGIFLFHLATLTTLVFAAGVVALGDFSILQENLNSPPPGGVGTAIFFGFAAAMLGVSGFESSANFIEEQAPGVFVKTLRNMWIAVAVFNPVISLLSLALMPLSAIGEHKETLLAEMGKLSVFPWLQTVISIDAVLVLSGAVLTSFVGVGGLVRRMSLDRCLPQFLLAENKVRKTNHWIFIGFFLLCTSILFATEGDVETLAGVYTISFLSVMGLFALGNMLLKIKRNRLPRDERASWPAVMVAFIAALLGILGNGISHPEYLTVFGLYFGLALLGVGTMFMRLMLLKGILFVSEAVASSIYSWNKGILNAVKDSIEQINSLKVIYFTRGDDLARLNRAALYVMENEQTKNLEIVHLYLDESMIPPSLERHVRTLDEEYPQLKIDLILIKCAFSPEAVLGISERFEVPTNYMFIGTPSGQFPHHLADLGGVRLII